MDINQSTLFNSFQANLVAGDDKAWQQFMDEFHPLVNSTAARTSYAERDDITQEIYFEIVRDHFKLLRAFTGASRPAFLVYLKRIAENVARNYVRKHLVHKAELANVLTELPDERPNPEAVFLADDDMQRLSNAIAALRQDYRDVLRLLLKGFRHREIGQILGIPVATSVTYANRACMILKKVLNFEIISQREDILL